MNSSCHLITERVVFWLLKHGAECLHGSESSHNVVVISREVVKISVNFLTFFMKYL